MSLRSLPPYTHIPGVTRHPIRDPAGHSYEAPDASPVNLPPAEHVPLTWAELPDHPEFQWAVRLFHAGYYWESHEAWEALWHAAGRTGDVADFLKGLIKLAAAGVKLREHNFVGVDRHGRRALELFTEIETRQTGREAIPVLVAIPELIQISQKLVEQPPALPDDRTGKPLKVLPRLPW